MFVSYAQNFEDVLLWRALKHVKQGFYIDIGAQDPNVFSVSRAFYEQGWRGVHVEPVPRYADMLREARPDEEVVQAAIATTESTIPFFDIPDTGLSTGKAAIAAMHERDGRPAREIEVTSIRLATLLDRYGEREIHWLKIDVEDMEREVLESWSPSRVRPWIVVIESTLPLSQEPSFAGWEPLIVDLGYEFAHFDGLNRFYVHVSKRELKGKFEVGVNVFDEFSLDINSFCASKIKSEVTSMSARHERDISVLSAALKVHSERIESLEADLSARDAALAEVSARARQAEYAVAALRHSTSWRITAPIRGVKAVSLAVLRWPKAKLRLVLEHAVLWLRRRPAVASLVLRCLRIVPLLERRLLIFARARAGGQQRIEKPWALDPDPDVFNEWRDLLKVSREKN